MYTHYDIPMTIDVGLRNNMAVLSVKQGGLKFASRIRHASPELLEGRLEFQLGKA
jgi:hypothetical protein